MAKTAYFTIKYSSYVYIKLCKYIERGQILVLIDYSNPSFLCLWSDKKANKKKQNKYH